jgi:hypothetical protein
MNLPDIRDARALHTGADIHPWGARARNVALPPRTKSEPEQPRRPGHRLLAIVLSALAIVQLATLGANAAFYSLDNNTVGTTLNASDGTEPLDNWWANEFTALAGGNLITSVDFGCSSVATGVTAVVSIYRVTGAGGNPALGATRLYSQNFTPVAGSGVNLNHITLTNPVSLSVGDRFLVAVSITNVIGLPPNDKYPFIIDNGGDSTGSYWARSAPGTFNLDNLTNVVPISQALATGGFVPGDYGGHLVIRAIGSTAYSLDNNTVGTTLNASDGTEPLDNWWANEFTALAGGNLITSVDFGCSSVATGVTAVVSIYRVTGAGGNPALGATRLYSQNFTPVAGSGVNLNHITLTNPVPLNIGDRFLVAVSITNVIGLPPNDKYPFIIDNGGDSTGSYWARSAPGTLNLNVLTNVVPISQALATGGFVPGDYGGHLVIRAFGTSDYLLDNNTVGTTLNASDGTEPLDNWWANEFTAMDGGDLINKVYFGCSSVVTGSTAVVAIYRVTDPSGNPALGATRLYSQTFTPVAGSGVNINEITLTNTVSLKGGDRFLVAILITNVIGLPPNDKYPFIIDNGGDSTGSYWARSAPNTFNLDNLTNVVPISQALATGGFVPGDYGGHLVIRAGSLGPLIPTTPTTLTYSVVAGRTGLQLSWPQSYTGWRLLTQTNGLGTTWFTVPGSTTTNQITVPINPANGTVFYRLAFYP